IAQTDDDVFRSETPCTVELCSTGIHRSNGPSRPAGVHEVYHENSSRAQGPAQSSARPLIRRTGWDTAASKMPLRVSPRLKCALARVMAVYTTSMVNSGLRLSGNISRAW